MNPRLWALSFMIYEILFVTHSCPILSCLKCWSRKCNNFLVILDSSRNVPSQQNIQNVALKDRQTGLTNETRRSFEGLRIKTLGCCCRCCHRRRCRRCCCCRRVVVVVVVESLLLLSSSRWWVQRGFIKSSLGSVSGFHRTAGLGLQSRLFFQPEINHKNDRRKCSRTAARVYFAAEWIF